MGQSHLLWWKQLFLVRERSQRWGKCLIRYTEMQYYTKGTNYHCMQFRWPWHPMRWGTSQVWEENSHHHNKRILLIDLLPVLNDSLFLVLKGRSQMFRWGLTTAQGKMCNKVPAHCLKYWVMLDFLKSPDYFSSHINSPGKLWASSGHWTYQAIREKAVSELVPI